MSFCCVKYALPEEDGSLDGYAAVFWSLCAAVDRSRYPCCFDKLSDKFEELYVRYRLLNLIMLHTRYHIPRPGWIGEVVLNTVSRITGPGRVGISHISRGLVKVYCIADKLWLKW